MSVEVGELAELCASDWEFYCKTFFPRTFPLPFAKFHGRIWELLENPNHRKVAVMAYRGSAKTTFLRVFTSHRIAYGVSRTILYVSKAQDHSERSLGWLKRQVERNEQWSKFYGLSRGDKWSESIAEVHNRSLDVPITIIALGIDGQVRGVNIDDCRPDLIVLDDPLDDVNSATPDLRSKMENRIFGALLESLAVKSISPDAKLVFLQTPIHMEDSISKCMKDESFASMKVSCFTEEGESAWPEQITTEDLLAEKKSAFDRNLVSTWYREKEVSCTGAETVTFLPNWLKFWEVLPQLSSVVMYIDPVPPPSDVQISKGLADKDWEVLAVVGLAKDGLYVCEIARNKGHQPDWTIAKFFELADRWQINKVVVDMVAYQRVLKWLLEKEMAKRRRWIQVVEDTAKLKSKIHKITQGLSGPASQGRFYVHRSMTAFIDQFMNHPSVSHDDDLDAVAGAARALQGMVVSDLEEDEVLPVPEDERPPENWRNAP